MGIEPSVVEAVNKRVYREYPEMRGARPSVSQAGNRCTLVYKAQVKTPAGPMARVVRVVADEKGRILRISTSK
ncbi:MAG: hypothetical protein JW929_03015 [Anaerolineales bacterium]|nr:hypothetical protein [Anaerolineales bacterium]